MALLDWLKHQLNSPGTASSDIQIQQVIFILDRGLQTGKSAGLVSVIFKPEFDITAIRKFCDSLKLFKLGFSWGGPVSLVMFYDSKQMRRT